MLTALTTGVRFRLAIALTTFAALCFVAPPAVLAFGHGENTAQCLSHADAVNHGTAKPNTWSTRPAIPLPSTPHQPTMIIK